MALFSVADLKTHLGITGTTEDAWLSVLVSGVDAAVKRFIGRTLEQETGQTLYKSGKGQTHLYLKGRPITAIGEVRVDRNGYFGNGENAFGDGTELTLGQDWTWETLDASESNVGKLIHLRGGWPSGIGNIKVTGVTSGYAVIPDDIKLACCTLAAVLRKSRKEGSPLQSETLGSYSYNLLRGASGPGAGVQDLADARSMLKPYREVVV